MRVLMWQRGGRFLVKKNYFLEGGKRRLMTLCNSHVELCNVHDVVRMHGGCLGSLAGMAADKCIMQSLKPSSRINELHMYTFNMRICI